MSKINKKSGTPVFGQLLSFIPRQDFNKSVQKHQADRYIKRFTSWDHMVTMLFGVIHKVGGLRELCSGMARHLGMTALPTKSTLSDRNKSRTPKIFEELFFSIYKYNRWILSDSSLSKNEKRSEELTSELQSRFDLVCRLMLEKKNNTIAQKRIENGERLSRSNWKHGRHDWPSPIEVPDKSVCEPIRRPGALQ